MQFHTHELTNSEVDQSKWLRKSVPTSLSPHLPSIEGVDDVLLEDAEARGEHGRPEEDVGDARPRVGLADADAAVSDGEDGHEAAMALEQFLDSTQFPETTCKSEILHINHVELKPSKI